MKNLLHSLIKLLRFAVKAIFSVQRSAFSILIFLMMQGSVFLVKGQASLSVHYDSVAEHNHCKLEPIVQSTNGNQNPISAPIAAYQAQHILHCGVFDIYFEDMLLGNGIGFDDAINGLDRRNTLCAVLTYLQSVFDFSQVPQSDKIRIEIRQSYQVPANPPPLNLQSVLAFASPVIPAVAQNNPGYYGGMIYDKITNYALYSTYNYNSFDGFITYNFGAMYNNNVINTQSNHLLPLQPCQLDMYSILLHEVLHLMGWFSMVTIGNNWQPIQNQGYVNNPNAFSVLDKEFNFFGDIFNPLTFQKIVIGGAIPTINPNLSNALNLFTSNSVYSHNTGRHMGNNPVYSGTYNALSAPLYGSMLSHLDEQDMASFVKYPITPGYFPKYVMGPMMSRGIREREISIPELRMLMQMGYVLNPMFANTIAMNNLENWFDILTTNHKPVCLTDYSEFAALGLGAWAQPNIAHQWAEGINPANSVHIDFTITNNNTIGNLSATQLIIDLNALPQKILDNDGDLIFAIPESLVGIRGVGNGFNNHDRLVLSNNNTVITYTPGPDYIGLAQFYVQLFDQREPGEVALFTIQVQPGANVANITMGDELIINGSFEEGTDSKVADNVNLKGNEYEGDGFLYGKDFYRGYLFSDGHPFSYCSRGIWNQTISGIRKFESENNCSFLVGVPFRFGILNSFNISGFVVPSTNNVANNKIYSSFVAFAPTPTQNPSIHPYYSRLKQPLQNNHMYRLSWDMFIPPNLNISTFQLSINGTNVPDLFAPNNNFTSLFNIVPIAGQLPNTWHTFTQDFLYCSNVESDFLELIPYYLGADITVNHAYIDNLSLVEIPLAPMQITSTTASPSTITCGQSSQLNVYVNPQPCNVTYNWIPASGLNSTTIMNPIATPTTTTIYTVTVTDIATNMTVTSTVTVSVNPITILASAAPSTICPGQSSVLTASGATNYTWQPGGMLGASITVSPSATTIYTLTGTTANCSATTTITVTVLPPSATACVCPNMPAQTFINPLASDLLSFYGNPPNNTIFGQTLGIDGTLLVDVDITFVNSHLLMAPDALISYSNPVLLTFDDNTIVETPSACPMWIGIEQNMPGSSLHSLSSTIRDMKDGIITTGSAINSPQLLLESSHFENNYFSVQLQSLNANNVTIVGNQFQTTSPFLKSPYSLYPRGEQGIRVLDCPTMDIGNTVTDGNHFENLFTGIYIKQFLTISSSQININYNTFHNIHGGTTLWPSPLNMPGLFVENDTRGCAIFGENNNSSHVVQFSCLGFNSSPLWDFSNCQKGILVKGFRNSIHFNRMNEVDGAVLLYKCEGNSHSVTYNTLENTYLGIGAWGNMGGGGIMHNAISVKAYPFVVNPNYGSQFWGKGIELGYFSNSSPGNMAANHNTISSTEPEWIIGLNVYNSPYGPRLNNTISFTSSSAALNTSFTFPALRGISLTNSINNQFVNNTLNGTYQASNTNRRSTGFWLHRSPRNYFSCNTMDQTRYGMYVVGNNATGNPYAVVGNRHNPTFSGQATHYLAWVFRHLGTEATFGNIGDLQHDNHNTFGPLSAYTGGFKVFKFCNAFQNDLIYTNPLTLSQAESGSNNGCGYGVLQNNATHNQYDCATGSFVPVKKFTLAEALDIAQDSVVYPEYQPIARWMDQNDLYHQLCHDTAMRYSSPILLQFYTTQHADATRYIAETNDLLEALAQDMTGMSPQEYQDLLADAETRNAQIQSLDVQEQNEHDINRIYLHYLRYGSDSISAIDAALIEDLAMQCPYIAGTAVYKARSLYALYRPGFYIDDMAVCNAAGVYKNGKGLFDDENDVLENLQGNVQGIAFEQDMLWVYPNPTQGIVTIASKDAFSQASWILKDMAGRSIAQGTLYDHVYSQKIILPQVAAGIYQLQVECAGKLYVNKLTIE